MYVRVTVPTQQTRPAVRAGLLVLLGAIALSGSHAQARPAKPGYPDAHPLAARSKTLCEAQPSHVFVRTRRGSTCIAYLATQGYEDQRHALMFFDGDVPLERFGAGDSRQTRLTNVATALQGLADKARLRVVRIARLGLDGSSGNHGLRHRPDEVMAMNAAVDALKAKLGLDTVALAGQSRGAMIAASLLTLGRGDVTCAALGSGVYEHARFVHQATLQSGARIGFDDVKRIVFDPSDKIGGIRADARRRIFVLGDPGDRRTTFDQQARFAIAVAAAGHHVQLVPIKASDELRHGATAYALNVAARCSLGQTDAQISLGVHRIQAAVERNLAAERADSVKGAAQGARTGAGTQATTPTAARPITTTGSLPEPGPRGKAAGAGVSAGAALPPGSIR